MTSVHCSAQLVNWAQNVSKEVWPSDFGGFNMCFGLTMWFPSVSSDEELESDELTLPDFGLFALAFTLLFVLERP